MNYFNYIREYLEKKHSIQTFPVKEKAPFIKDWQSIVLDDDIITSWEEQYIGYADGFGVRAGQHNIGFYDIDTDDEMIINKIESFLDVPNFCVKVGKKGKTVFFRYTESLGITKKNFYLRKGDKKPIVEFFITVGQTVLPPSIHPETKAPYRWVSNSLLDMDVEDLPYLDLEKLNHLQDIIQAPSLQEGLKSTPENLTGNGSGKFLTITKEATRLLHLGIDDATIAKTLVSMDRILFKGNQFFHSSKVGSDKRETDIETAICWITTYKSSLLRTDKDLRDIMMREVRKTKEEPIETNWMPIIPMAKYDDALEFPEHLFPITLKKYCFELADMSSLPPEAFLSALFVTFSAVCQAKALIHATPMFRIHPSVSAIIIAPSGSRKDTVFDWAREPMMKLVRAQLDNIDADFIENEKILCDEIEELNKKRKAAIRENDQEAIKELKSKMIELQNSLHTIKKQRPDNIFESGTQEKLYETMDKNQHRGIFICASEYVLVLGGFNKKGNESMRGFFLKLLNGSEKETFTHQTKTGTNVNIRKVLGCALLGAQTDVIAKDIRAMERGDQADGLLQRFLLINVNPKITRMKTSVPKIDSTDVDNIFALYYNSEEIVDVTWEDEETLNAYLDYDQNLRIRTQSEKSAIKSFRSKFSGHSIKIAYLYEALNNPRKLIRTISKKSFLLAVEYLEWCSKNIDITWSNVNYNRDVQNAELILSYIRISPHRAALSVKELNSQARLHASEIEGALSLLCDHNYIRKTSGDYEVNPEIYR